MASLFAAEYDSLYPPSVVHIRENDGESGCPSPFPDSPLSTAPNSPVRNVEGGIDMSHHEQQQLSRTNFHLSLPCSPTPSFDNKKHKTPASSRPSRSAAPFDEFTPTQLPARPKRLDLDLDSPSQPDDEASPSDRRRGGGGENPARISRTLIDVEDPPVRLQALEEDLNNPEDERLWIPFQEEQEVGQQQSLDNNDEDDGDSIAAALTMAPTDEQHSIPGVTNTMKTKNDNRRSSSAVWHDYDDELPDLSRTIDTMTSPDATGTGIQQMEEVVVTTFMTPPSQQQQHPAPRELRKKDNELTTPTPTGNIRTTTGISTRSTCIPDPELQELHSDDETKDESISSLDKKNPSSQSRLLKASLNETKDESISSLDKKNPSSKSLFQNARLIFDPAAATIKSVPRNSTTTCGNSTTTGTSSSSSPDDEVLCHPDNDIPATQPRPSSFRTTSGCNSFPLKQQQQHHHPESPVLDEDEEDLDNDIPMIRRSSKDICGGVVVTTTESSIVASTTTFHHKTASPKSSTPNTNFVVGVLVTPPHGPADAPADEWRRRFHDDDDDAVDKDRWRNTSKNSGGIKSPAVLIDPSSSSKTPANNGTPPGDGWWFDPDRSNKRQLHPAAAAAATTTTTRPSTTVTEKQQQQQPTSLWSSPLKQQVQQQQHRPPDPPSKNNNDIGLSNSRERGKVKSPLVKTPPVVRRLNDTSFESMVGIDSNGFPERPASARDAVLKEEAPGRLSWDKTDDDDCDSESTGSLIESLDAMVRDLSATRQLLSEPPASTNSDDCRSSDPPQQHRRPHSTPTVYVTPSSAGGESKTESVAVDDGDPVKYPTLVKPLDNDAGIPKGDIILSLLSNKPNELNGADTVKEAIWRCRTMRRNCDTQWLLDKAKHREKKNSPALQGRTPICIDVDDARVHGGLDSLLSTQRAAFEHLKYDNFDDALALYDDILQSYGGFFEQILLDGNRNNSPRKQQDLDVKRIKLFIGVALHNIGVVHLLRGDVEAGDYEQAYTFFERATLNRASSLGPGHCDHISSLVNMAICRYAVNDFPGAHSCFEEALILARANTTSLPDQRQLAEILNNLGCLSYMCGQIDRAMDLLEESLGAQNYAAEKSMYAGSRFSCHTATLNTSVTRASLGLVALVTQDLSVSVAAFESALRDQQLLLRDAHDTLVNTMDHLVVATLMSGHEDKALQLLGRMLHMQVDAFGPKDPRCATTQNKIVTLRSEQPRDAAASLKIVGFAGIEGKPDKPKRTKFRPFMSMRKK